MCEEFFGGSDSSISKQLAYSAPEGKQFYPSNGVSGPELAQQIYSAIDYYVTNEQGSPIAYPPPWFSWVNSILSVVSTAEKTEEFANFLGADAAHDIKIHPMYFMGRCQPCKPQNPAYR